MSFTVGSWKNEAMPNIEHFKMIIQVDCDII